MTRWTLAGTWLANNNYSEIFLNFPIHEDLQQYCEINVTQFCPELKKEGDDLTVGCWLRSAMGVKSFPYNCTQGGLQANQIVKGNRPDPKNPFQWDHIEESFLCSETYNTTCPEVQKVWKDGDTASNIVQYIDDAQTLASIEERLWLAQSKMTRTLSYLGLQDAAFKRRMSMVSTNNGVVTKSVLRDRWSKTQQKVRWIGEYLDMVDEYTLMEEEGTTEERVDCPADEIPFKKLERIVGFLVYVSQTYTCMVPYLKGIYLTLNSWRYGRDETGWKIPKQQRGDTEALDELPP